jgi:predicted ester cyclase
MTANDEHLIRLDAKGDIGKMMAPDRKRVQSLHGFDDDYTDIVDYIIRCTHKIWEEGGIGLIYTHYAHNVTVWTTSGRTYGRESLVESTLHSLAAFPNRRLYGDEVIWSGNDRDGFHTSHRLTSTAKNTGYSWYGPPTGHTATWCSIANCLVKENRIVEEWVVSDTLGLLLQLGFDQRATLEKFVQASHRSDARPREYSLPERVIGQTTPVILPPKTADGFDVEDFVRRSFHEIWNWRLLNKIDDYYALDYVCHTTCERHLRGRGHFKAFVLTLLGAFSDAVMSIEHFYFMGNDADGYRTMTRWNLQGTHKGAGPYGEPTGQPFYLMGISQHTVKDGRFVEEWTYFDEVALLQQLWK